MGLGKHFHRTAEDHLFETTVKIHVPATTANLGPGFDCLGMALDLYDEVTLSLDELPRDGTPSPEDEQYLDLVMMAANHYFAYLGKPAPVLEATCSRTIPLGRGLGSSAAAIVAGLLAADELSGSSQSKEVLAKLATELEGHPDNAVACINGGLQLCVLDDDALVSMALETPAEVEVALFVPDFALPTHETRQLLPESLSRQDVVYQSSRTALLAGAIATGRLEYLRVATQDRLHQPARSKLFTQMNDLFDAALEAGALCAYLSGGGPTVAAWTRGSADGTCAALASRAEALGLKGTAYATKPSTKGAVVTPID